MQTHPCVHMHTHIHIQTHIYVALKLTNLISYKDIYQQTNIKEKFKKYLILLHLSHKSLIQRAQTINFPGQNLCLLQTVKAKLSTFYTKASFYLWQIEWRVGPEWRRRKCVVILNYFVRPLWYLFRALPCEINRENKQTNKQESSIRKLNKETDILSLHTF